MPTRSHPDSGSDIPIITDRSGSIFRYLSYDKNARDKRDLEHVFSNGVTPEIIQYAQDKDHWLLYLLFNSKLRLSNPENFNDPYDCTIEFSSKMDYGVLILLTINYYRRGIFSGEQKAILEQRLENKNLLGDIAGTNPKKSQTNLRNIKLSKQDKDLLITLCRQTLQNLVKESRLICFSKTPDISLMWSHYTDKHSGYCLEFSLEQIKPHTNSDWQYLYEMQYRRTRPRINLNPKEFFTLEMARKILLRKSPEWKYEEEVRYIHGHTSNEKLDSEYVTFPPTALKRIIFGARMPENYRKAIQTIVSWLGQYRVRFAIAKPNPHKYKIDIEDL